LVAQDLGMLLTDRAKTILSTKSLRVDDSEACSVAEKREVEM
jgi:hypothetical protein